MTLVSVPESILTSVSIPCIGSFTVHASFESSLFLLGNVLTPFSVLQNVPVSCTCGIQRFVPDTRLLSYEPDHIWCIYVLVSFCTLHYVLFLVHLCASACPRMAHVCVHSSISTLLTKILFHLF